MKLTPGTKKILKIASLSALAILEIYLIYACAASMYTYHQHPRFESASGQVAQSSGYRSQFFVCIAFAVVIPLLAAFATYMYWFRKPKTAKLAAALPIAEAAAADGEPTEAKSEEATIVTDARAPDL